MSVKKLTLLGLLTALALIIFVVELQLPPIAPIPGLKLGLANIITVFSVYRFSSYETALILIARILLGSFFAGSMLTMIYSLSGGVLCLIGMLLLKKVIDEHHIWVCSILGAVLHNIGQTAAAVIMMQSVTVIYYLPFLLCAGCVAGLFTGVSAQIVIGRLKKNI